jgi:hypothetical protein
MRLIDADALWMGKFPPCGKPYQEGWNDALDAATTQAPTIDAVPVVRCEECKRWKRTSNCRHGICSLQNVELMKWKHDFCSYGERKDNG